MVSFICGHSARLLQPEKALFVHTVRDIAKIPTSFDLQNVIAANRVAFESSNVRIHKIINIVYLIYRFVQGPGATRR